MRTLLVVITTLCLFGCKPSEKGGETPKARFEPQSSTASQKTAPPKQISGESNRQTELQSMEDDLTKLERDVTGLQIQFKTRIGLDAAKLNEEAAALNAKIAVLRGELTTATKLDDAGWSGRREKLKEELAAYRAELETLMKKGEAA